VSRKKGYVILTKTSMAFQQHKNFDINFSKKLLQVQDLSQGFLEKINPKKNPITWKIPRPRDKIPSLAALP